SSRRRHTRSDRDWSSDVCSSDLNAEEARQVATDLASDRFIAYSTWKWIDLSGKTGGKPVYRYYYARPRPPMNPAMGNVTAGLARSEERRVGKECSCWVWWE